MRPFSRIIAQSRKTQSSLREFSTRLKYRYAVTREIDDKLYEQALCFDPNLRASIDIELARKQHRNLVESIKKCGIENTFSLPSGGFPDSVFIEDTAVIANDTVFITIPGAVERRGETVLVKRFFEQHFPHFTIKQASHGKIDGGDVLYTG